MLCYAILCYGMLQYAMLCYAILCFTTKIQQIIQCDEQAPSYIAIAREDGW